MRKALFITAVVVLATFLASIPAQSAEGVACATIELDDYSFNEIERDAGLGVSIVGHFVWLQNTDYPDSLNNIVSSDLDGYEDGAGLTVCTDGIADTETITTGVGAAAEATTSDGVIVVYSTDDPHPEIVTAWMRLLLSGHHD